MDIRDKAVIYNFLTVVFAVLAVVSVGGIFSETSVFTGLMNLGFFGLLSYNCARKETSLRKEISHRKHVKNMRKRLSLSKKTSVSVRRAA